MAATTSKASLPPGSFGAILKRSKFASYDRSIAQVYTSHGGAAFRGDWGLKRPLPLRARGQRATVGAVDTSAQQTEWDHAVRAARWVRMFNELGMPTKVIPGDGPTSWHAHLGTNVAHRYTPDSDAVHKGSAPANTFLSHEDYTAAVAARKAENDRRRAANEELLPEMHPPSRMHAPIHAVPQVETMTERAWLKYERQLRRSRPEFLEYLAQQDKNAYHDSYSDSNAVRDFLGHHARNNFKSPSEGARIASQLAPQPHPTAGLRYSQQNTLQAYFTGHAVPGRILASNDKPNVKEGQRQNNVSIAGQVVPMQRKHSQGLQAVSQTSDAPITEGLFRPFDSARVVSAPKVVGHPSKRTGLELVQVGYEVHAWNEGDRVRENPHVPGSAAWIAHRQIDLGTRSKGSAYRPQVRPPSPMGLFNRPQRGPNPAINILNRGQNLRSKATEKGKEANQDFLSDLGAFLKKN